MDAQDTFQIDLNQLQQKLQELDPSSVTVQQFVELVEIIDGHLQKKQSAQTAEQVRTVFKMSENILIEFSKSPNAWEVVYSAL